MTMTMTAPTGARRVSRAEALALLDDLLRLRDADPELAGELIDTTFASALRALQRAVATGSITAGPRVARSLAVFEAGLADRLADVALGVR